MAAAAASAHQKYRSYLETEDMSSAGLAGAIAVAVVIVVGTIALVRYVLHVIRKVGGSHSYSLPPGPWPWPIVGNLPLLGKSPHVSLARLARKYGPLMTVRLGATTILIASSADMAKEFLKNHDQEFSNRPHTLASQILGLDNKALTFSDGTLLWRHLRKVCALELFNPTSLESFRAARMEELGIMTKAIFEEAQKGKPVNLHFNVWCLTANNITCMLMGKRYFGPKMEQEAQHLKMLVDNILYWFGLFIMGDFSPAFQWVDKLRGVHKSMRKLRLQWDAFLLQLIDEHKQQKATYDKEESTRPDFIDVLLSIPSENGQGHLPNSTILALIQDMLIAGADTSTMSVEWAMAELLRNPYIISRLQYELDVVVGNTRLVEEYDIPNLKYLQAIVKETFRLHPPAPLLAPHESSEACQVAGYNIPPKTRLLVNVWAIGRDATNWENPLVFDPERFVEHPKIDVKGQNFELLPFGSGRRGCVAMSLGLLQVHITLARLVHSFDWSLPNWHDTNILDMSERFNTLLPMKHPLNALLSKPRLATELYL